MLVGDRAKFFGIVFGLAFASLLMTQQSAILLGIISLNALAASLGASIVGATGDDWIRIGLQRLLAGESDKVVIPEYGALPNITAPRK